MGSEAAAAFAVPADSAGAWVGEARVVAREVDSAEGGSAEAREEATVAQVATVVEVHLVRCS